MTIDLNGRNALVTGGSRGIGAAICRRWRRFLRSVVAEVDKVAPGERTARLLHAAADREAAKMNRRETEARDQILHEFDRLRVISGYEDDAAATLLRRTFVEAFNDDRIERLHDPRPGANAATTSLAPLSPRSANTSSGLYALNGFVASMRTRPFHGGRPRRAPSTFGQGTANRTYSRLAASAIVAADAPFPSLATAPAREFRALPVAQHDLMASPQGLSRKSKRHRAGTDRSEPHDAAPFAPVKSKRTTPSPARWTILLTRAFEQPNAGRRITQVLFGKTKKTSASRGYRDQQITSAR